MQGISVRAGRELIWETGESWGHFHIPLEKALAHIFHFLWEHYYTSYHDG